MNGASASPAWPGRLALDWRAFGAGGDDLPMSPGTTQKAATEADSWPPYRLAWGERATAQPAQAAIVLCGVPDFPSVFGSVHGVTVTVGRAPVPLQYP